MLTNTHTINLLHTYLTRALAVLAGICALAVFLYGIFLLLAVSHTAARAMAQRQVSAVTAHVGDLEMQYLTLTKELTPEKASALGFVTPAPGTSAAVFGTAPARPLSLKQ